MSSHAMPGREQSTGRLAVLRALLVLLLLGSVVLMVLLGAHAIHGADAALHSASPVLSAPPQ